MSNREAAEALGVSEGTIRNDLGADKVRNNADKVRTPPTNPVVESPAAPEGEPDDVPDQITVRERYLRGIIADNLVGTSELPKKYRAILFDQNIEKYGAELWERRGAAIQNQSRSPRL
jgi:hypothetical protein